MYNTLQNIQFIIVKEHERMGLFYLKVRKANKNKEILLI